MSEANNRQKARTFEPRGPARRSGTSTLAPVKKMLSVAISLVLSFPLAAVAAAPVSWATEAGDSPETATALPFGTVFNGSVTTTNPKDFFILDLPSSGAATIEFQTTAREPVLTLLDSSMKVIRYGWPEFYTGFFRSFPFTFLLVKGTHYLRIERHFPRVYYDREQADVLADDEPGMPSFSGTYSMKVTFESSDETILDTQDVDKSVSSAWAVNPGETYHGQISAQSLVNVDSLPLSDPYAPSESLFYYQGDRMKLAGRQFDWYKVTVEARSEVEIKGGAKIVNEGWSDGTLDVCFGSQPQTDMSRCFLSGPANSDNKDRFEVLPESSWYGDVLDKGTYYLAIDGGGAVGLSYYFSVTTKVLSTSAKSFTKTYAPAISGTAKVGKTLTAKVKAWSPSTGFKLQWLRSGKAIDKAIGKTYEVQAVDVGKKLTVDVTSTKSGYKATARTSKASKQVAKGTLTVKKPKIEGTQKVGMTLRAGTGKWTAGTVFTYQWLRGGKRVRGATSSTYVLMAKDKGKRISVKVSGSKDGYKSVTKTSANTGKIKK